MRDEHGHRDDAVAGPAGRTYRPHAGTWNARVQPAAEAASARHDPFAALGHEASRHGQVPGAAHVLREPPHDHVADVADALHEHPVRSLWPHADDAPGGAGDRRTAWTPDVVWRPTPSVPFPRPAPPTELDPPTWG
ncbi:hypothetical protein OMK64_19455 [Cellulomonas fimi]|uniref:hypothetical protein n=1 Tax=Cellulomonas fimi TaxID=1708 RepID=UPI00234E004B|nr:hypothetical protein [Cellulomonas fimi]MDC7123715.1 hypothetical protein [Cellulomonas fimi]